MTAPPWSSTKRTAVFFGAALIELDRVVMHDLHGRVELLDFHRDRDRLSGQRGEMVDVDGVFRPPRCRGC